MPSLNTFPASPTPAQDYTQLPPNFPAIPDEILERFDSAQQWQDDLNLWYKQISIGIGDAQDSVAGVANQTSTVAGDLVVQQGDLSARITTETNARITADEVLAQRIVTVSAIAGVASNITVQNSPPGAPALNDYWVNNTDPLNPITYQWNGASWVQVTVPISAAAVATEQTARITADGFLSGKYTLTVVAGNVVTGMNITSSTGGGTNVSSVIFNATNFLIYNGVTGVAMFNVAGSNVQLASVLTVSTAGKVFTGTGTYANNNTPFYVDSSSNFSLGASLTWNGTTLTITGSISATTGMIGGWTVGATTLTGGTVTLDSTGTVSAGSGGNFTSIGASGLQVGGNASQSVFFVNNNAGNARLAFKYNGNFVLTAAGTTTGATMQFSGIGANSGSTLILTENSVALLSSTANAIFFEAIGVSTSIILTDGSGLSLSGGVYSGSGASLTSLNASNISSGTINNSFLPSAISVTSLAGSGSSITSLNASNISSGTLNNSRLPSAISVTSLVASTVLQTGNGAANSPSHTFINDASTGWFLNGAGDMRGTTSGVTRFVVRDTAIVILVPLKYDTSQQNITSETLQKFVTAQDSSGSTIKLGIVA